METVEQILEGLGRLAQEALVKEKMAELPATFVIPIPGKKEAAIIPCPWQDDREKNDMVFAVWLFIHKNQATSYGFISECWHAEASSEELKPENWQRPSDRVDRVEIVLAFAVSKEKTLYKQWKMIRDWKGIVIKLEEWPFPGEGAPVSWLANLLTPPEGL